LRPYKRSTSAGLGEASSFTLSAVRAEEPTAVARLVGGGATVLAASGDVSRRASAVSLIGCMVSPTGLMSLFTTPERPCQQTAFAVDCETFSINLRTRSEEHTSELQ